MVLIQIGYLILKKKNILFLSIYLEDAETIGDVRYIGIYLDKLKNSYVVPDNAKQHNLVSIQEFNTFFKHLYGNHYHPNEISAELLSIYYLSLMKLSHENYKSIGYNNMLVWLNKNK